MRFNPNRWLCADTYGRNFAPLPMSSGVYLLEGCNFNLTTRPRRKESEVLYVGKSLNLKARVTGSHEARQEAASHYDHVARYFIAAPPEKLDRMEAILIRGFQPKLNYRGTMKMVEARRKAGQLPPKDNP